MVTVAMVSGSAVAAAPISRAPVGAEAPAASVPGHRTLWAAAGGDVMAGSASADGRGRSSLPAPRDALPGASAATGSATVFDG